MREAEEFYSMESIFDLQMAKQFAQEAKELEEKKQSFHKNHEARMSRLNSILQDLQKISIE